MFQQLYEKNPDDLGTAISNNNINVDVIFNREDN